LGETGEVQKTRLSRRCMMEISGMWVFGYGSLMGDGWEVSHGCTRRTRAELRGYQRVFNKASVKNWGTKAHPCPTLNVVKSASGACRGIAFEFPGTNEREVRDYLIEREGKAFPLRIVPIRLDDGSVAEAAVPIYEGKNIIAARDLQVLEQMIRGARGTDGSGIEYVQRVANELKRAGIDDPVVAELAARIAHRSK
jgi:glutathione-specific gamma-glutamylcyclotransferase